MIATVTIYFGPDSDLNQLIEVTSTAHLAQEFRRIGAAISGDDGIPSHATAVVSYIKTDMAISVDMFGLTDPWMSGANAAILLEEVGPLPIPDEGDGGAV